MKKPKIFADYKLLDTSTIIGRQKIIGAINHFMSAPDGFHKKALEAGIKNFTVTSAFADEMLALIDKIHLGLDEIDVGYKLFFDERNFEGVGVPGFRIRDVTSGLSFTKRPEGGRAQIYRITGTEAFATFDTYGGGLELDQAWFDDQEWWMIEDTAAEFRHSWFRDKATVFYDLIGNIGAGQDVSYDAVGSTQLDKDINTINGAASTLITAMQAAGYAVTANTPLILLTPIQLKARTNRAFAAQYVNAGVEGASLKVEYNITPVFSLNVRNAGAAATDKWYMGVPGLKNKIGEKMPLTTYADFNARNFATTVVGWGRYAAYLNETQFQRLDSA